jgi:hypothetical protein
MNIIFCPNCHFALRVLGEQDKASMLIGTKSDFWPDGYICPKCEGKAKHFLEHEVDKDIWPLLQIRELTSEEAFSALHGVGLPEERVCTKEAIEETLKTKKISGIVGESLPHTERYILRRICFEDGSCMHLACGAGGATVYRISPPPSYAKKVLDELSAS